MARSGKNEDKGLLKNKKVKNLVIMLSLKIICTSTDIITTFNDDGVRVAISTIYSIHVA